MYEFRKKPVVIQAVRYTDDSAQTIAELSKMGLDPVRISYVRNPEHPSYTPPLIIKTPEGEMRAGYGDWIIKGVKGEFYPCKPEIFNETYEPADVMDFGTAIAEAKAGKRITRRGWNGKGMFVVYQKGYPDGIPCNRQTAEAFGYKEGDLFQCRPYLQMRCADGTHQMWVASQSDILADDWEIV